MSDEYRKIVDGCGKGICCGGICCKCDRMPRKDRVRATRRAKKILKRNWKKELTN